MRTIGTCILAMSILCTQAVSAQQFVTLKMDPGRVKVDDGLMCWFMSNSEAAAESQVKIFDRNGKLLTEIGVLRVVPEAKGVSVYDVAVRNRALVAVAAVYSKGDGTRPASALLYFDFTGKLLTFLALPPSRGIDRLAIDENLNVWTLTGYAGDGEDPAKAPMIVKYDAKGRVVEEMLPRNQFPFHAAATEGSPEIGFVSLGYDHGTLWFWLPGSTDLVTIRTDSGSVSRASTGLPHGVPPRSFMRLPSGSVIAETVEERPSDGTLAVLTYMWAPATKQWTAFAPPACSDHTLIGVAGEEILLTRLFRDGTAEICAAPLPQS